MTDMSASIVIDAPADVVWGVIAGEFDRIGGWATAVPASTACPVPAPDTDAPVPARVCHTGIAQVPAVTETVVAFDQAGRWLTYEATDGMPAFVDLARNRWQVTAEEPERARVTFAAELRVRGPLGWLLRWWLLARVGRSGRFLLDDLKHYVEQGRPSPRKRRQLGRAAGDSGEPAPAVGTRPTTGRLRAVVLAWQPQTAASIKRRIGPHAWRVTAPFRAPRTLRDDQLEAEWSGRPVTRVAIRSTVVDRARGRRRLKESRTTIRSVE